MNNVKKEKISIIDELKNYNISVERWYFLVNLYQKVKPKLNIKEAILFANSLVKASVILINTDDLKKTEVVLKELNTELEYLNQLKNLLGTSNINSKVKI